MNCIEFRRREGEQARERAREGGRESEREIPIHRAKRARASEGGRKRARAREGERARERESWNEINLLSGGEGGGGRGIPPTKVAAKAYLLKEALSSDEMYRVKLVLSSHTYGGRH